MSPHPDDGLFMTGHIVIISDTHLGRPNCAALSAKALRPLWQDASQLIINGDIAEIHHPKHADDAREQVNKLYEYCERDGIILTMLSGNHDPYISDLRHVHLAEGNIFVTHGDVLHPAIVPWSPSAPRVRIAFEKALSAVKPEYQDNLISLLAVSEYVSAQECRTLTNATSHSSIKGMLQRPWSILKVLYYWKIVPHMAAQFTKHHSPKAKYMIFGHTHRPGIWHFEDMTVINTGSFGFPGRPWAVTIEDLQLSVWKILRRKGTYCLAKTPVRTYELPVCVSSPSALNTRPVSERPSAAVM